MMNGIFGTLILTSMTLKGIGFLGSMASIANVAFLCPITVMISTVNISILRFFPILGMRLAR